MSNKEEKEQIIDTMTGEVIDFADVDDSELSNKLKEYWMEEKRLHDLVEAIKIHVMKNRVNDDENKWSEYWEIRNGAGFSIDEKSMTDEDLETYHQLKEKYGKKTPWRALSFPKFS